MQTFITRSATRALVAVFAVVFLVTACSSNGSGSGKEVSTASAETEVTEESVESTPEISLEPTPTTELEPDPTATPKASEAVVNLPQGEVDFQPFIDWLQANRSTIGAGCVKADPDLAEPAGPEDRGPYAEIEDFWPLDIDPEYRVHMCGLNGNFQPGLVASLRSPLIAQMSDGGHIYASVESASAVSPENAYPDVESPWWPESIPVSSLVPGETYCRVDLKGANDPTAQIELSVWPYVVDGVLVNPARESWGVFDQFQSQPVFMPELEVQISTTKGAPQTPMNAGGEGLTPGSILGWTLKAAFYPEEACG